MRLTVYETDGSSFRTIFRERIMAGLAGYLQKDGALSEEGIACASAGLLSFKDMLGALSIDNAHVFATAALRNAVNSEKAASQLQKATGFEIEIISGIEEAMCGYTGAMTELNLSEGTFIDIGGASTEISVFGKGGASFADSFPVGALLLYKNCVKKLIPGKKGLSRLEAAACEGINKNRIAGLSLHAPTVCVGGTARAALKLARSVFDLPKDENSFTARQLDELCGILFRGDRRAVDLILKNTPDRVHTIIPGLVILRHTASLCKSDRLCVSQYGVREGYLCRKILTSK